MWALGFRPGRPAGLRACRLRLPPRPALLAGAQPGRGLALQMMYYRRHQKSSATSAESAAGRHPMNSSESIVPVQLRRGARKRARERELVDGIDTKPSRFSSLLLHF